METDHNSNVLVLQGAMLSQIEQLPQLVEDYKKQLEENPAVPVVLDMNNAGSIYSRGIGIILGLFKTCKAANRDFRIIASNDDAINVFKILKLDKVISIQKVER